MSGIQRQVTARPTTEGKEQQADTGGWGSLPGQRGNREAETEKTGEANKTESANGGEIAGSL